MQIVWILYTENSYNNYWNVTGPSANQSARVQSRDRESLSDNVRDNNVLNKLCMIVIGQLFIRLFS